MFRHVDGKQTFYPLPKSQVTADTNGHVGNSRVETLAQFIYAGHASEAHRVGAKNWLTEAQRQQLTSFVDRFDAAENLEVAMRLVSAEVSGFFAFQACKTLQRLAKRFGQDPAGDPRLKPLLKVCAETIHEADPVSLSRAIWAMGKLHLRDEALVRAAATRIPAVLSESGPIAMATIWWGFEQVGFADGPCLDIMAKEVLDRINVCDPPEIAIVLHATAVLDFSTREPFLTEVLKHVKSNTGDYSARHLAVCLHAAARMGHRDDELCRFVTGRFTNGEQSRSLFASDTMALTSAVYACGLVGYTDLVFLDRVADHLNDACKVGGGANGPELASQQVANMVYSFGKLGYKPERCLHSVASHVISNFDRFKCQELDNITYGFALLKFRHEAYLGRLCDHLVGGRALKLDVQSIVSMVYSYGILGFSHHPTLRLLGDLAIQKLPTFQCHEITLMVYSLGLVNFRHHDLLTAVCEHAPRRLPECSTQNISNMLHGLGCVSFDKDDKFVESVAEHMISRLPEVSAQDIANSLTALMRMCIPYDRLLLAIADYVTAPGARLPVSIFTPQELANTLYAFDALRVVHPPLINAAAFETSRRVEEFIPQEVANVLWAVTKMGFEERSWMETVLVRCAPFAESPERASGIGLSVVWGSEDLEKPLAALWPWRKELPSFSRLEVLFYRRYLEPIRDLLMSLAPRKGQPEPALYQKAFAAFDLYQVGPHFTQDLLAAVGISRTDLTPSSTRVLLDHYVGAGDDSMLARHGEKLLISVLPTARWLSCRVSYRLFPDLGFGKELCGSVVVEAGHAKDEDSEASQRRLEAKSWRAGCSIPGSFRPVLVSTFLGNWRHRHTELMALDELLDRMVGAWESGAWRDANGSEDVWLSVSGEVELFVPHTPCLSCVGAMAQFRAWFPRISLAVSYMDWREWRAQLRATVGANGL